MTSGAPYKRIWVILPTAMLAGIAVAVAWFAQPDGGPASSGYTSYEVPDSIKHAVSPAFPSTANFPEISVDRGVEAAVLDRRSAEPGGQTGGGSGTLLTEDQGSAHRHLDLVHSPPHAVSRTELPAKLSDGRSTGSAPMSQHPKVPANQFSGSKASPKLTPEQERQNLRAAKAAALLLERLEHRRLMAAQLVGDGLTAQYYTDLAMSTKLLDRVDPVINLSSAALKNSAMSQFSVDWTGYLRVPSSGQYTVYLTSDDGARLWIDGKRLIDHWQPHSAQTDSAKLDLDASRLHSIRISYYQTGGNAIARFEWAGPNIQRQLIPKTQLFSVGRRIPYKGIPAAVGETIQAEDYDIGGQGVSFSDRTWGNAGGVYRSDNPDVFKTAEGGYAIENFTSGEWAEYSIDVPADGKYDFTSRMSGIGSGTVSIAIDGISVASFKAPDTGGPEAWNTVGQPAIPLSAGVHIVRMSISAPVKATYDGSVDWLRISPSPEQLDSEAYTPDPVGAGPALDAKAIARWDVVPYQTFDGDFNAGVVAFHSNGIDHVSFSIDGGAWVDVSEMTLNPQTGVVEYWTSLQASDFRDGPITILAVAYPKVGVPRVLDTLKLNANATHTLDSHAVYVSPAGSDKTGDGTLAKPFATPGYAAGKLFKLYGNLDNDTIYLAEGDYSYAYQWVDSITWPTNANAWLTIAAAPGASPDRVRFVTGTHPGFANLKVHLQNVTVAPATTSTVLYSSNSAFLWFDKVTYLGPGVDKTHMNTASAVPQYWTDCSVSQVQIGYYRASMVRNSTAVNCGEDAFKMVDLLINSSTKDITFANSAYHPDVWQYFSLDASKPFENVIVYGLKADHVIAQGVGPSNARDVALVNIDVDNVTGEPPTVLQNFQAVGLLDNIYILNSRFIGANNFRTTIAGFSAHNVVVEKTVFDTPINPSKIPGVTFR